MKNIKKSLWFICLLGFVIILTTPLAAQKGPKDTFTFSKLNQINLPEVHEVTLPNGLQFFLVEDRDYPTIDLRAQLRSGSVFEPADKIGLASITGSVMRTGGSKKYPGDQLDTMLETLAASVGTSIGQTSGSAFLSVLKEDIGVGLDVLLDLLTNPVFPEDKIELAKVEYRSAISRRNDDIAQIAGREYTKLIFGSDSPYARQAEYATIEAIERDDLVSFHKQYFHPNNMMIALWGDFDWKNMKTILEKKFSSWKKQPLKDQSLPEVNYQFDSSINYIEKTDVNQAYIYFGHIGGYFNNPDYPAIIVMNQILSFERMFKRIRTDEGLAYTVSGSYGSGFKVPGTFTCLCQTKSESAVKAVKLMIKQIEIMQQEMVTDTELEKAKNSYLNSFVFNFDSKAKILSRFLTYKFYGYPDDFNARVKEGVEKVTKDDVLRVAKKYLHPDNLRILVVGNQSQFDEPLSIFGDVNEIDITIPQPETASAPSADSESIAKAQSILEKTATALGGIEKLKTIKNVKITAEATMMGMVFNSEAIFIYPDRMWNQLSMPNRNITMVITPGKAWMDIPGQGKNPMPAPQKESMLENMQRDIITILVHTGNMQKQYIGKTTVEGQEFDDILLVKDKIKFHLLINQESFLPAALTYTAQTPQGPAEAVELFLAYKDFSGIKIATHTVVKSGGQVASESKISQIEFNADIDPSLFN